MFDEEDVAKKVDEHFERLSRRSKRTLFVTWVTFVVICINVAIGYARLRQDRLCYSREDVVAVAAGVAERLTAQRQAQDDGGAP